MRPKMRPPARAMARASSALPRGLRKGSRPSLAAALLGALFCAALLACSIPLLALSHWAQKREAIQALENALRQTELGTITLAYTPAPKREEALAALIDAGGIFIEVSPATGPYTQLDPEMEATLRTQVSVPKETLLASERNGSKGIWVGQMLDRGRTLWSFAPIRNPKQSLTAATTLILSLSLLIAALICWPLARALAKDFSRLPRLAASVEQGEVDAISPEDRNFFSSEAQSAAAALERMGLRLAEQREEREMALAALGHDLKSPLARAKLAAEISMDERAARSVTKEMDLMSEMISGFSDLARSAHAPIDPFNAVAALGEAARVASEMGASFALSQEPLWIMGNAALINRAALNLLENAKTHGGGARAFRIGRDGSRCRVEVEDRSGADGISATELAELVEPFRRGDPSRSKPGSGLGLSIAARAANLCKGELRFERAQEGGMRCFLLLPLMLPHSPG